MINNKYLYQDGLETDRLTTKFIRIEDVPIWTKLFESPSNYSFFKHFHDNRSPVEKSKFWIEKMLARYEENRYGLQWLEIKGTGTKIGQCGLLAQDIDGKIELEVGYALFQEYWGKGYATEAARMFHEYGLQHNLADSVISIIDINNFASQKVAERNDMTRDKQTFWFDMDVWIYRGPGTVATSN